MLCAFGISGFKMELSVWQEASIYTCAVAVADVLLLKKCNNTLSLGGVATHSLLGKKRLLYTPFLATHSEQSHFHCRTYDDCEHH